MSLIALSLPMRATLLLNGCGAVTIVEGQPGQADCVVQNLGNDAAFITGVFAYVQPFGPDFSDNVLSVQGVGEQLSTVINPSPDSHDFQFRFTTDTADSGETPDFGLNVFSVIFRATDIFGNFIPGSYMGGIVTVLDDATVHVTTTMTPPTMNINSPEKYMQAMQQGRGFVNSDMPEPNSGLLLLAAAVALIPVVRKGLVNRNARRRGCDRCA